MSIELKVFGGAYFPKDKALKKNTGLKPLVIAVNSTTKAVVEAVIFGKLAAEYPEWIEDYFKAKVWEHRDGLPCPAMDVFSSDFFETAVWIDKSGEPAPIPMDQDDSMPAPKSVARLDLRSRAACLSLFGPVEEISAAQYGLIVDLTNDDESSFTQNLAEAISKETRVLSLEPERQGQLLAWVRETAKETAQWPEIARLMAKWLDVPLDKRPQTTSTTDATTQRTESGTTLGGGNQTDRSPDMIHNLKTLAVEVALAIISSGEPVNIYAIPSNFLTPAKAMAENQTDPRFTAWWKQFRRTPGILDFSRAAIIALIKSAPEGLSLDPVALREYINRALIESDHAKPTQEIIDIACGTVRRDTQNDETRPLSPGEADAPANMPLSDKEFEADIARAERERDTSENQTGKQLAAGRGEFVSGISDPSDPKWIDGSAQPKIENLGGGVFSVDALINNPLSNEVEKQEVPPALNDREIKIATELNELLSARTDMINEKDVAELTVIAGHPLSHLIPLVLVDIVTTEFSLSPDFTDEEIHDVATTVLESWSDDLHVRQKIMLDAIVEYRTPAPPKCTEQKSTSTAQKAPELELTLIYRQQLTIAALQGLCANPAYCVSFEELPGMATLLANSIINQQGEA
ncbi:exodeoxyribonuclease VIII [Lelliottia aquatilis]|uniref:exodeoxyribonuclease VIII n=1 Tax=Lelliottia aquatilis TaxID=2080838 RepID=UPI000CDE6925|nr:exodeoxyribonuclease VIII [Lelliottia aquatilis]POZ14084.1 exodeoxyribonuclease VIII [Lelliottia aquatilis]